MRISDWISDVCSSDRVGREVLVVHEHERVAVLVREGGLPARELDFLQLVVAAEAEVELVAAGHRVQGEAELDVAAAALWRAALDVAHLVDGAVVLDHVSLLDVVGFHAGLVVPVEWWPLPGRVRPRSGGMPTACA